jgi:hypothetical protein
MKKKIFGIPIMAILVVVVATVITSGAVFASFAIQPFTSTGTITVNDPYNGNYSTSVLAFTDTTIWQDKPLTVTATTVFTNSGEYPVVGFDVTDIDGVPEHMSFSLLAPVLPVTEEGGTTTLTFQITAPSNTLDLGSHSLGDIACTILPYCIEFTTGLTQDGDSVDGNLADGFTIHTDGSSATNYILNTSGLTASPTLSTAYHSFYLVSTTADLSAYFHAKGWLVEYLTQIDAQIAGNSPFFYIKDGGLVDGFKKDMGLGDQSLTIDGDYPVGTYTYRGDVTDADGATRTITVKMTVTR